MASCVDLGGAKYADKPPDQVFQDALKQLVQDVWCYRKVNVGKWERFPERMVNGF